MFFLRLECGYMILLLYNFISSYNLSDWEREIVIFLKYIQYSLCSLNYNVYRLFNVWFDFEKYKRCTFPVLYG